MPTRQRKQCESDVYHVMQRGTGQMDIFEDERDRIELANALSSELEKNYLVLLAWCFMGNHIHLLVRGSMNAVSDAMRSSCAYYARWFNIRHQRTGVLFQGRFTSVPVESDSQLLTVVRYIHKNPVVAKLSKACEDYRWSSYCQYLPEGSHTGSDKPILAIETDLVLDVASGVDSFIAFHNGSSKCKSFDIKACGPCSDDESRALATDVLRGIPVASIGQRPQDERDGMLRRLKQAGFGTRLLQRLTGINYNAIRNA